MVPFGMKLGSLHCLGRAAKRIGPNFHIFPVPSRLTWSRAVKQNRGTLFPEVVPLAVASRRSAKPCTLRRLMHVPLKRGFTQIAHSLRAIVTFRRRSVLTKKLFLAVITLWFAVCTIAMAQTLTSLKNPAPDGAIVPFLLTDGTVLVQGNQGQDWWKLTPDINGSYVNGTWTQVASLASDYDPYAMASQTLADGRVLIEGGEYNFGQFSFTNMGAIYDPALNTWTPLNPPPGWDYIGDSPSLILPNGHFLIGRKFDTQMAELDPATLQWTAMGSSGKADWNAEEGWTLMPDGTVLTADVLDNPNSERYIPSLQEWVSDGSTIANLQGPPEVGCITYGGGVYCPPGEIGPAILRPDGTVFATGATHQGASSAHTSVYHHGSSPTDPGT